MPGHPVLLIVGPEDTLHLQYAPCGTAVGLQVEYASDTELALAKATFGGPDVVLTDWSGERASSGAELCRRLKGRASTSRIPVLGLISQGDTAAANIAVAIGCTVLAKPCSPERLLVEIVRVLNVRPRGPAHAPRGDYVTAIEQLEHMLGHVLRQNAQLVQRTADLKEAATLWANWYERALSRLHDALETGPGVRSEPSPGVRVQDAVYAQVGAEHD